MEGARLYLYGIIRCGSERGFDDVASIGGGATPVRAVAEGPLAAVVSVVPATEMEGTRANMLAHQRVLERVMREFTVLPVRFGTVAAGAAPCQEVRRLLATRSGEFLGLLGEMDGMVELGLKALWRDLDAVIQEVAAREQPVRRLRASIQGKPAAATHYQRIRLGEMVKAALERQRESEARRLLGSLERLATRMTLGQPTSDRMVADAAFLVEQRREEEFDGAVAALDAVHGGRVALRYVGPVPPYNFVNIVVSW